MTLRRLLLVMLGGMLGTAGRLALGLAVPDAAGIPIATLLANVLGALLIGVLAARPFERDVRAFLMTGILGGFTTYSAFAVGSIELWADAPLAAVTYSVLSLGLGVGAVALGFRWGRPRERTAQ